LGNGNSRTWVYVEEVRVAGGFYQQSIDAFALHLWPSKNQLRVAYEVKASRSDLKRELDKPEKAKAAIDLSNQFYLVAPPAVLSGGIMDSFPAAWGVMTFGPTEPPTLLNDAAPPARLTIIRRASYSPTPPPGYDFMLSLARNLQARADGSTTVFREEEE
jgi:hypothetical protein